MPENTNHFSIRQRDILWSAKTFILSVLTGFTFSISLYTLMLIVAEPAPVSEAIASTASAATAKVVITAAYISPLWSIFIFNTIAAFTASVGTGLFMLIHPLLIADIQLRSDHRIYASFSIAFERMLMPANRLLQRLAHHMDDSFPYITPNDTAKDGVWKYCGYGREDYRMIAYMLPYTIPFLILIVNGALMGILLAFFIFNGLMTGFEMFGIEGMPVGVLYNLTYFIISIAPHGIIEIPALLLAASLGYRFARVQSHEIIQKGLFLGNSSESMKLDVANVLDSVKGYIFSGYVWKVFAITVLMLLFAAYIEAYVTLGIVDRVMLELDNFVGTISS
jgi:uncharacterized membrane protein SpoIIM required for sporulation